MALTIQQSPGGVSSSIDSGAVPAPAVNQIIADSGPLSASNGETISYVVDVTTFVTGTAEPALTNMLINVGGTNTAGIISVGQTLGKLHSSTQFVQKRMRVNVQNGQHVYIVSGNTASAGGSIYNASLSVSRNYSKYTDV